MKKVIVLILALLLSFGAGSNGTEDLFEHAEMHCLAKNIYYEARGEGYQGMLAVGQVTLNRAKNPQFPSTLCGVVYQKGQFSWTVKRMPKPKSDTFAIAQKAAMDVLNGTHNLTNFNALYFHNSGVTPAWSQTKRKIKVIKNHHYYK
jgi:spore germination cell wall hydrolase CwlJ-like protein